MAAGLGLVVALAGWIDGEQNRPDPPWGTQVEVVVHRVVPQAWWYLGEQDSFTVSRDEHAMLKPVQGLAVLGHMESHQVHVTLINHTDTGYLISPRTLDNLFRGRVRYTDVDDREWNTIDNVRTSPTAHEPYTVPLTPNGRREMVLSIAFARIDPPEDPNQPGSKRPLPDKLRYAFQRPRQLLALPIQGNTLGDPIRLRANGRGACEVGFDGPM